MANNLPKIMNYINGELVPPNSKKYIDNIEPATGNTYSLIPDSDVIDVKNAIKSAEKAFKKWSNVSIEKRAEYLESISLKLLEKLEYLSKIESKDNGKPLKLAKSVDIPRAGKNFNFFASAIKHFHSESHEMVDQNNLNFTLKQPLGVVGAISPWNLPLYLFTWKIAPALAVGNTVVAKPSEITPMSAFELAKICIEVGLPKGVLNIVHGRGNIVGENIVNNDAVKAITFTGGTITGKRIAEIAAPKFKKLSLELGGKNPNIIFDDCDFDKMIQTTIKSSFANQGQICLCGSRIYVHENIYEKFKSKFIEEASKLKTGDPNLEDNDLGAIVSKEHLEKISSYINLAKNEGGTILFGGNKPKIEGRCKNGYFMSPTIIEGLGIDCRTNQEEIFGPVVTLQKFSTEEEALELANGTNYGLSATLWTQDISRVHRMVKEIQAGVIWVNAWMVRDLRTPFGGMKDSGVGREGGFEVLEFFTEKKNVSISY